jgi:hypothetical protein
MRIVMATSNSLRADIWHASWCVKRQVASGIAAERCNLCKEAQLDGLYRPLDAIAMAHCVRVMVRDCHRNESPSFRSIPYINADIGALRGAAQPYHAIHTEGKHFAADCDPTSCHDQ